MVWVTRFVRFHAAIEWNWQHVFPSPRLCEDPRRDVTRRHHRSDSAEQRDGTDLRPLQKLLGPEDVRTTMKDPVLQQCGQGIQSPLDTLDEE